MTSTTTKQQRRHRKKFIEVIGEQNYQRLLSDLEGSARSIVADGYDCDTADPQFEGDEPEPIPRLHLDRRKKNKCRMFVTTDEKTGERIYMELAWKFFCAVPVARDVARTERKK